MQFISQVFILDTTSQNDQADNYQKREKVWGDLATMQIALEASLVCLNGHVRVQEMCTYMYQSQITIVSTDSCTCKSGIKSSDSR